MLRLRKALPEELDESVEALDVQEQIGSEQVASHVSKLGRRRGRPVDVHLDVDTGMGRSGFLPDQIEHVRRAIDPRGLRVVGLMTDRPTADPSDLAQAEDQLEILLGIRRALAETRSS